MDAYQSKKQPKPLVYRCTHFAIITTAETPNFSLPSELDTERHMSSSTQKKTLNESKRGSTTDMATSLLGEDLASSLRKIQIDATSYASGDATGTL